MDTIEEFLEKELPEGGTLGFDGRTVGLGEEESMRKLLGRRMEG